MKNKLLILCCLFQLQLVCQIVTGVDTLQKKGPISKRINLVIMGDGYTTAQIPQFVTNATTVSNYLLNTPPFSNYKNYFNVYAIKCQSPQSGVSHPGTATDVTEPASPTLAVTNNFDTRFDNYNVHRLIYSMNSAAVYGVLAASFPAYDQALILGNSTVYGGAGGAYGVSSIHPSSPEIVAHEMGHSFAGLADEYWAGPVYATEKPNMTANNNNATVKWNQWIGQNAIGTYPYDTSAPANSWYRPHQNCKMRYLNSPFCSVCKQTIIEKIHSLVNPIDGYSPDNNGAVMFTAFSQWFATRLVKPVPNTLRSTWELNSGPIAHNQDSVLLSATQLGLGNNGLIVTVCDTTVLTKDSAHVVQHTYSVVWNVYFTPTGIGQVSAQMELSMYPNPASERMNVKYNLLSDAETSVMVTDMSGRTLIRERSRREPAGEYKKEIDVSQLVPGNYILTFKINEKIIQNKFIISK